MTRQHLQADTQLRHAQTHLLQWCLRDRRRPHIAFARRRRRRHRRAVAQAVMAAAAAAAAATAARR